MLCSVCEQLDIDQVIVDNGSNKAACLLCKQSSDHDPKYLGHGHFPPTDLPGYRHHESYSNLISSARSGCALCNRIWRVDIHENGRLNPDDNVADTQIICSAMEYNEEEDNFCGISAIHFFQSDYRKTRCLDVWLDVFTEPDDPAATACLISGRPINEEASSDKCLALVDGWIEDCLQNHPMCPQTLATGCTSGLPRLPTRVIDVGPTDGSEIPKLYVPAGERGSWIALSHCWGDVKTLMAETPNLEALQQGIPPEIMPELFKDAVHLTRYFGHRYLWIDSLCILQDSEEDWVHESSKMRDVYMHASLTIAADASFNSDDTIFVQRSQQSQPIELQCRSNAITARSSMFLRPQMGFDTSFTTLRHRAWALQEDLLSPRTIHFGMHELYWSCQSRVKAEGNMSPPISDYNLYGHIKSCFLMGQKPLGVFQEKNDYFFTPLFRWYRIVDEYAKRRLTDGDDIFPALSGLASEVQSQVNDTYNAGLWSNDMHRGLLWSLKSQGHKTEAWRAPSWSWATLHCDTGHSLFPYSRTILMHERVSGFDAKIISVDLVFANKDLYGRLLSGSITIDGRWQLASFFDTKTSPHYNSPHNVIRRYEHSPRIAKDQIICDLDEASEIPVHGRTEPTCPVSYLQVAKWADDSLDLAGTIYALILKAVPGMADAFTRIGIAEMPNDEDVPEIRWEWKTVKIV